MKTIPLFLLSALCFSQAQAYDLPEHTTQSYYCDECDKLSHATLHAHWNIKDIPLRQSMSNEQKSYSYNQIVSAEQLQQGVALYTRAPGAVVRITPLEGKTIPELEFRTAQNQIMALKEASALYAKDESLGQSLLTTEHQTMMQIKPELGFGTFVIKSKNQNIHHATDYLINVFDKFSLLYLKIEPQSLQYQYGEQFNAIISLKDNDYSYDVDELNATLISPNDELIPLKITKIKRNQFQANAKLSSLLNTHGDNWHIQAEVFSLQDDAVVQRTARTAFSYSVPSASLVNIKRVSFKPLTFTATVTVATASRYALQSVLFYNNKKGEKIPVQTSQSSQWLEQGKQTIQFSFDNSRHLEDDTLSVGYLHLTDYGQLKTVYQYNQPIKLSRLMD
jgi:hypothetical protein